MPKTLIIGYGNPGRLDDGLGPALAEAIEREHPADTEIQSDYQLSAEHAWEIAQHERVVFADAAVGGRSPYFLQRLMPRSAQSFSTHSMRPEAILALAEDSLGWKGQGYLLGIRGYAFNEFGEGLSAPAGENLLEATYWLTKTLRSGRIDEFVTGGPIRDSVSLCAGGDGCAMAST